VLFSIGSASCRRICSRRARSDSRRKADRLLALRLGFFTKRLPKNRQHSSILWSTGCCLALDDIREIGDGKRVRAKPDRRCPRAQRFELPNTVDLRHEIELKAVAISHDAVEL